MGQYVCKSGKNEKREERMDFKRKSILFLQKEGTVKENGGALDQAKRLKEPWAPPAQEVQAPHGSSLLLLLLQSS